MKDSSRIRKMLENPYTLFIAAIIVALFTVFSAWYQANKTIKDKDVALKREENRVNEHIDLQKRSNEIIDSTKQMLDKQNQSLRSAELIIDRQDQALKVAKEIINKQNMALESQSILLNSQNETFLHVTGGDGKPRLIMRLTDFYSTKYYKVDFIIDNPNKYPLRSISAVIKGGGFVNYKAKFQDVRTQLDFDEQVMENQKAFDPEQPTIIGDLFPNTGQNEPFKTVYNSFSDISINYEIFVRWLSGYYKVRINVTNKDYDLQLLSASIEHSDQTTTNERLKPVNFIYLNEVDPEDIKRRK